MDDYTFDWVALAPIEAVAERAEQCCVAQGMSGVWYSSAPGGIPVKGCRIVGAGDATLAVLTLQGYQVDQTHLRLQPAARSADIERVSALADALYAALRAEGWIPSEAPLLEHTPRFVRPRGFRPRAGEPSPGFRCAAGVSRPVYRAKAGRRSCCEAIWPSRSWYRSVANSAAAGSCVAITNVTPSWSTSARSRLRICSLVLLSRSPVGSSARIIFGRIASARAIATRCCCPPLIS